MGQAACGSPVDDTCLRAGTTRFPRVSESSVRQRAAGLPRFLPALQPGTASSRAAVAGDYECVGAFTAFCDATNDYVDLRPLR